MSNNTTESHLMTAHVEWRKRPADQRFQTLAELRAAVHARRMQSRSLDIDLADVEVKPDGEGDIAFNGATPASKPSHWAFGQFASMLGAPAQYLRTLPTDLLVDNIKYGLANANREAVKWMTVAGENGNTLQAVTSTTYGRIWDADCVDAVQGVVDRTGGKFFNPKAYDPATGAPVPSGLYASDRDVFMFMIDGGSFLDAGNPRDVLNRGFIAFNSEVGAKTFGLITFLHRGVCGNHIIWNASDVRQLLIRHSKNGPARFASDAAPALKAYCESSATVEIAAIRKAQDWLLPTERNDLDKLGSQFRITRGEITQALDYAKREEGDNRTLWQFIQGLTAYARGFDYVDSRVDLETRAGNLMKLVSGN